MEKAQERAHQSSRRDLLVAELNEAGGIKAKVVQIFSTGMRYPHTRGVKAGPLHTKGCVLTGSTGQEGRQLAVAYNRINH